MTLFVFASFYTCCPCVFAQLEYERVPIRYSTTEPADPIAILRGRLDAGEASLKWNESHGWLPSLLKELEIPVSSQTLVFSKTSLQRHRITPSRPRAIYFNDDVYVAWVQRGSVVEISSTDPLLGAVFYTLDLGDRERPAFDRHTEKCLICHGSTHTRRVPGHIVRSVYTGRDGMPVFSAGTYRTDHTSPFEERWGGWYVTGTHGDMLHLGNQVVADANARDLIDPKLGSNITDLNTLSTRVRTKPYLSRHSDIVALSVLEHQVAMHNQLTSSGYNGRFALHDADVINKALKRADGYQSESTLRRLDSAAERIIKCLLYVDEFALTSEIAGTSDFTREFQKRGPFDSAGRSLRDFDLSKRLFRYPCSFLIYSEQFGALPAPVLTRVYSRLLKILQGEDKSDDFAHLSGDTRQAILEILRETKSGLPADWGAMKRSSQTE
jgi:hypothetical protein